MKGGSEIAAGRILVVDDDEKSRHLLREILEAEGYFVRVAEDGEAGLASIEEEQPEVILLDVMMPNIDGFEVCRRIKSDPNTAALPVLLVTALDARNDQIHGIEAGANDYLTKPIDRRNVVLRVRNAVQMRRLHLEVARQYGQLEKLERQRDSLVHMMVHDMRSPLMGISGNIEIALLDASNLSEGTAESLQMALASSVELVELVSSLLDVSRMESGKLPLEKASCDIETLAREAAKRLGPLLQHCRVTISTSPEFGPVVCDPEIIRRVFINLLANAGRFSPKGSEIKVTTRVEGDRRRVEITDQGLGVPEEDRERIFEKFGTVALRHENRKGSTGLGLTFCKMAVEAHGGAIGIASGVGQGSTFWFDLPLGIEPAS